MKLVVQNGSRVWGGNEKWMSQLTRGFLDRGHRVVVSCVSGSPVEGRLRSMGVPVTGVRPRGDLDVVSAWRFRRWLGRSAPDALLLTTWRRLFWGAVAGRGAGVPRIAVRLGIVRPLPAGGLLGRAVRDAVDLWVVNAPEIRDAVLASAPDLDPERVRVLLNAVEPPPAGGPSLRETVDAPDDARVVAAAGHVTRRKGYDLVLDALGALDDPRVHLAVAGRFDPDGEARPFVERASRLGLDERVHWLGVRDDVPALLSGADAFVLSSRNEGMANVMLEAMAAGRPVVATDVSGVRTALGAREGRPEAGWIVPPEDPAALAEGIRRALEAGPASPRALEAAWRARHWFGTERMLDEAEALLFG